MRKNLKYISASLLFAVFVFFVPTVLFADVINPGDVDPTKEGWTLVPPECLGPDAASVDSEGVPLCGFPEFLQLIANVMGLLMVIALSISALLFAIAGFRYVTAAGNTTQVEGAKKMFFNVAIGLAIVFAAYLIVQVIVSTLGVVSDPAGEDFNQFLE